MVFIVSFIKFDHLLFYILVWYFKFYNLFNIDCWIYIFRTFAGKDRRYYDSMLWVRLKLLNFLSLIFIGFFYKLRGSLFILISDYLSLLFLILHYLNNLEFLRDYPKFFLCWCIALYIGSILNLLTNYFVLHVLKYWFWDILGIEDLLE